MWARVCRGQVTVAIFIYVSPFCKQLKSPFHVWCLTNFSRDETHGGGFKTDKPTFHHLMRKDVRIEVVGFLQATTSSCNVGKGKEVVRSRSRDRKRIVSQSVSRELLPTFLLRFLFTLSKHLLSYFLFQGLA